MKDAERRMMKVECTRLQSGLTVVTENMPHLESVALGVWIKSGSRDETTDEHGIAHLLEHMAFKGTARRTAREIAEQIENVGGEVNAATSTETTSYYARILQDDVPLAVDILADILTESGLRGRGTAARKARHPAGNRRRQRHARRCRLRQVRRNRLRQPDDRSPDPRHAGNGLSFTPQQIRTYLGRNYTTDRMFVVGAGAVDHEELRATGRRPVRRACRQKPAAPPVIETARYTGGDVREDRDLMDAQVLLGFEGKAYHARDFYCSQILANILGGGMSSRLFQEVREHRGLCYSVYAFHWGFSDTGIFGVHAATGGENLPELMPVIIDELRKSSM